MTASSRSIFSCNTLVWSLTWTILSWVFLTSSWSLATFSVSTISAWLPLRLSWSTPAVRSIQTSDASMIKTTRTFPAVDIGPLLPGTQWEKPRRNQLTPCAKHLESYRPRKLLCNGRNRSRIATPAFGLNLPYYTLLSGIPPTWRRNLDRLGYGTRAVSYSEWDWRHHVGPFAGRKGPATFPGS